MRPYPPYLGSRSQVPIRIGESAQQQSRRPNRCRPKASVRRSSLSTPFGDFVGDALPIQQRIASLHDALANGAQLTPELALLGATLYGRFTCRWRSVLSFELVDIRKHAFEIRFGQARNLDDGLTNKILGRNYIHSYR